MGTDRWKPRQGRRAVVAGSARQSLQRAWRSMAERPLDESRQGKQTPPKTRQQMAMTSTGHLVVPANREMTAPSTASEQEKGPRRAKTESEVSTGTTDVVPRNTKIAERYLWRCAQPLFSFITPRRIQPYRVHRSSGRSASKGLPLIKLSSQDGLTTRLS